VPASELSGVVALHVDIEFLFMVIREHAHQGIPLSDWQVDTTSERIKNSEVFVAVINRFFLKLCVFER
jgi:hypothetical protein